MPAPYTEAWSLTCPTCSVVYSKHNSKEWMLCRRLPCVNFVHLLCYPHGFCPKTMAEDPTCASRPPLPVALALLQALHGPPAPAPAAAVAAASKAERRRSSSHTEPRRAPRPSPGSSSPKVPRPTPARAPAPPAAPALAAAPVAPIIAMPAPIVAVPAPAPQPSAPTAMDMDMLVDKFDDISVAMPVHPPAAPVQPHPQPPAAVTMVPATPSVERLRGVSPVEEDDDDNAMLTDEEPSPVAPVAPIIPGASLAAGAGASAPVALDFETPNAASSPPADAALLDRINGHIVEALMRVSHKSIDTLRAEMGGRGIKASTADVRTVLAHMEAREVIMVDGNDVFRI